MLLAKLPLPKQRKNVIQQDAENCQQKILTAPAGRARLPSKSKGTGALTTWREISVARPEGQNQCSKTEKVRGSTLAFS
jgi:hypothetical protein